MSAGRNKLPAIPEDAAAMDAFIEAGAAMSGIAVDPAYRDGVRVHLNAVTNAAKLVLAFELDDDAEPGPVFVP